MSNLIEVDGFTRFRVTQDADGKTSFLGTAKIKGATYFFTSNDLLLPDGTHGLAAVRWETFTGKTVRGSATANTAIDGAICRARCLGNLIFISTQPGTYPRAGVSL